MTTGRELRELSLHRDHNKHVPKTRVIITNVVSNLLFLLLQLPTFELLGVQLLLQLWLEGA